jgi:hypothetical protein
VFASLHNLYSFFLHYYVTLTELTLVHHSMSLFVLGHATLNREETVLGGERCKFIARPDVKMLKVMG